jgi:hypothetical protein
MTIVFSKFLLNGAAMDAYEVNATSPEDVPQIASVSGDGTRVIITLAEERRQGALRVKLR